MDPINETMKIGASGMNAQATRLRVISENVANAQSTGSSPGADPYRRKTITFQQHVDRATGTTIVQVKKIGRDMSAFPTEYNPSHPAASAEGYVKTPNINSVIEMADMRETSRSYEANVNMVEQAKAMMSRTIELLK